MAKNSTHQAIESLLLRIREGDDTAFAELLTRYEPLVAAAVARYGIGLGTEDREDLRQIALIALCRAARNFDLEQSEVEFGLFAKVCVANAIISQLRIIQEHRKNHTDGELLNWSLSDGEDPARRIMEEEAFSALAARIRSMLSPYEHRVWTLHIAGYRSGEIAKLLAKDPHSIENAVYRIRQKLRRGLDGRD